MYFIVFCNFFKFKSIIFISLVILVRLFFVVFVKMVLIFEKMFNLKRKMEILKI